MLKESIQHQVLVNPLMTLAKDKLIVVKMGGSFLDHSEGLASFLKDINSLHAQGLKIVIVHGGGKDISKRLNRLGIQSTFQLGYRVTCESAMEEVEMTLSGKINKDISMKLNLLGAKAVGISGKDAGLLKVRKKWLFKEGKVIDVGQVGEVISVEPYLIQVLLESGVIPVISPIGFDDKGHTYNVNADSAASAIAGSLQASKLMLMTDVKGLYLDYPKESSHVQSMTLDACEIFLQNGTDHGGMTPKVESAMEAIRMGTKSVHILNGSEPNILIRALTTNELVGTQIS